MLQPAPHPEGFLNLLILEAFRCQLLKQVNQSRCKLASIALNQLAGRPVSRQLQTLHAKAAALLWADMHSGRTLQLLETMLSLLTHCKCLSGPLFILCRDFHSCCALPAGSMGSS